MTYELALVELYLPLKHGIVEKQYTSSLYGNYLILERIPIANFFDNVEKITKYLKKFNKYYVTYLDKLKYEMNITQLHHIIRNYEEIVKNPKHYNIEIIESTTISIGDNEWDQYSTAIVKTHWIRLIQRKWREFVKTRHNEMKNLTNLKYKEIHGKYPATCNSRRFKLGLNNQANKEINEQMNK